MVENAYKLVAYYQGKAEKGEIPVERAQHYALETIRQIVFEPNGYFWIIDTYPRGVMHPVRKPWEGVDLSDYTGPDGRKLFLEMTQLVKSNGEGFIDYVWAKPDKAEQDFSSKTSFLKLYEPWHWIIGTGVYIDDINAAFWNAVLVACGLMAAVAMFILALAVTVFESLKKNRA